MIKGFLLYRVESHTCGLAIDETIKNAVDILSYAARALAARRDHTFIRAEAAFYFFSVELFVV